MGVYPWSSVGKIYNAARALAFTEVWLARVRCSLPLIAFSMREHGTSFGQNSFSSCSDTRGDDTVPTSLSLIVRLVPGYDAAAMTKAQASDWAVLTISTSEDDNFEPIYLANDLPVKNAEIMLPGFAQDHAFAMTADTNCHIVGTYESRSLMVSDCVALHGNSGARLLRRMEPAISTLWVSNA